jgi:hypothetical protein
MQSGANYSRCRYCFTMTVSEVKTAMTSATIEEAVHEMDWEHNDAMVDKND